MKLVGKLFVVMCMLVSTSTFSQTLKIGNINTGDLLKLMPDVKSAQDQLEKYSKDLQSQSDLLVNEYQSKLESYQNLSDNMSDAVKKDKETELVQLEGRIKKFQEEAQSEVSKKQDELLAPIMKKVKDAIAEVAKEKGYDYILDTSVPTVLYSNETFDITSIVKKKLGLN
jgi:outer membrane protein